MEDIKVNNKIMVLGKSFNSEEERRAFFREELRKKLPELKKMEGFPIGEDDDILNLSDPPFYTACPNPWLNNFIDEWEEEKKQLEDKGLRFSDFVIDEPYAYDVSEGKNHPIYNAHTYHTKVPHKAIMKYIEYYTQPGDIIYDGFSGTGMTGLAASSFSQENNLFEKSDKSIDRRAIINDLSPIASFIGYNLNRRFDLLAEFEDAKMILKKVREKHKDLFFLKYNKKRHEIEYEILSEIYYCENCSTENDYLSSVLNENEWIVEKDFICKKCGSIIEKNISRKVFKTVYDRILKESVKTNSYKTKYVKLKNIPGLISFDQCEPAFSDINFKEIITPKKIMEGVKTNDAVKLGREYMHQFYDEKSFLILFDLWKELQSNTLLKFTFTSVVFKNLSLLNNMSFRNGGVNLAGALPNALYFPSNIANRNPLMVIENKLKKLTKILSSRPRSSVVQTGSVTQSPIKADSIDYIFTDPPFGANLMYSELNFVYESWINISTNNNKEAIINSKQKKSIYDYQSLMDQSFAEYFRVLKPNKWMTVEFSSTSAAVWNSIQYSISKAGFVIANVAGLDKKQGTYNSKTTLTAVKQDLAISCYKPSSEFDQKFKQHQNTDVAVWDFVQEHLNHLPIHLVKDNATTAIIERSPKILFDRLIAFYVQKGLPVPIDAGALQKGLRERFIERDGMFFTNEQVQEYDKKKKENPEFIQLSILVSSEQDGVLWLKNLLSEKTLTYQDIQPQWMQALAGVRKGDVIPELADILEENFLKDDQGKWYVPDPENQADLEKLRAKRLLKQFEVYKKEALTTKKKSIKELRVEALRAGFKQCYQDKDFQSIVTIVDKIPNNLLMEDEVLLQFYDIASNRV
jgi:DNA modification methylase